MEFELSWLRKTNYEKMKNCLPYSYICSSKDLFRTIIFYYITDFYPESLSFIIVFMIWTKE